MATIDELRHALYISSSNSRPEMLAQWKQNGEITCQQLRELILFVWNGADSPVNCLDEETWIDWFEEVGFVSDRGRPRPTEDVTLYRGATISSGGRGLSWTFSRTTAHWFANLAALFEPAAVYQAVVPSRYILAIVEDERPGEEEAVVHPWFFDLGGSMLVIDTIPKT